MYDDDDVHIFIRKSDSCSHFSDLTFSLLSHDVINNYVCCIDVRRSYMIRNKLPGPYDDAVGPTVLSIMLMVSIAAQFAIKLISINS